MGEPVPTSDRLRAEVDQPIDDLTESAARAQAAIPAPIGRVNASTWFVFGGIVIATFAISLGYRFASDDPPDLALDSSLFSRWYIWIDILSGVLIAYIWAAITILGHGVTRDLTALRPSLDLTDEAFQERVRHITSDSPLNLFVAGTVGALALYSMAAFDPGFWTSVKPAYFSLEMLFYGGRQAVTGFLGGVAVYLEIRATRGFARLGAENTRIDLLDLRPLRPFAHKGLRSAATWLVSSSLVSLFFLSDAVAVSIGPIVFVVVVLASWVFLYPLLPLHNAIVSEKNRRLDRVRDAIRAESDPLQSIAGEANPRFANLVAYYNLIENAHEWPIETPTLVRLAAFATLGLGSWLGAAFVEQLVDAVFR